MGFHLGWLKVRYGLALACSIFGKCKSCWANVNSSLATPYITNSISAFGLVFSLGFLNLHLAFGLGLAGRILAWLGWLH